MEQVVFFEKIPIDPPREKIYQRLGFKKQTTELSSGREKDTDFFINEASSIIRLQGMFLRLAIVNNNGEIILLSEGLKFHSEKLSFFLRDCREAVLMGTTAGHDIMNAIKEKTRRDDLEAAVIYDATASEMTDAAMDWIMGYVNQLLRREGKVLLPRRFSAGYGDFDLKNQKIIFERLKMKNFGVNINPNFILIPEKSVTAISGIQ